MEPLFRRHIWLEFLDFGDSGGMSGEQPHAGVSADTGTGNTPHDANGTGWYFNNSWSWGFAPQGEPIDRFTCDIVDSFFAGGEGGPTQEVRLCWHTSGGNASPGWRCGANDGLGGATFERLVFEADF
jgi:hypothetical protein